MHKRIEIVQARRASEPACITRGLSLEHLDHKARRRAPLLTLAGRLDLLRWDALKARLSDAISAGHTPILLDLSGADYLSSPGLAVFLLTWSRLKRLGAQLVLCAPSPIIQRVFYLTGFNERMPLFASADEVLEHLAKPWPSGCWLPRPPPPLTELRPDQESHIS